MNTLILIAIIILLFHIIQFKDALKIYRRHLKDVKSCARMKEKMGDHKGAVDYCFSRNRPEIGLNLAKRYITEGLLEQEPELSKIAYTQIMKCLQTREHANVKTWVTFLPGIYQQVHILKQAKLYNDAYQLLRQEKMFKEAFRLLSAQGMFTDGIQLAKETEDIDMRNSFLLQQATKAIVQRRPLSADLQEVLSEVDNLNVRAKAHLLLVCSIRKETEVRDAKCAALCNKAMNIYTSKLRNKVGEIECFHLLRSLQPDKEKSLHSHGTKIVDMVKKVEEVCDFLEKSTVTATSSKLLRDLEEFYGLQKHGNSMYYMPDAQDLWIRKLIECANGAERVDSDGMLQLTQAHVKDAVRQHLRGYVEQWRKELQQTVTALQNKFKLSFPFHLEIKKNGHLHPTKRFFGQTAIQDYLSTCEVSLEVYKVTPQSFEDWDPILPLLQLLSPFSQLYMPFTKDTYRLISDIKILSLSLNNKVKESLDIGTTGTQLLTCDEWLKAWRVLSSSNRVKDIRRVISRQKKRITKELLDIKDHKPPYAYAYSYDKKTNSCEHYFSYWLRSCDLLKQSNKALVAIQLSMHHFVQVVARRRSLRKISTENLVNILSVHSSALLAMLSHSFHRQKQEKTVCLPETFQHLVQTFDLQNCHGEKGSGLLATSFRTANVMKPDQIQKKVFRCLYEILELLLGLFNEHFSTLRYSMKSPAQIESREATHCLLLTLTVYANLSICDPFNKNKLEQHHIDIIHALVNVNHHKFESAQPLQIAYVALQNCTTTQGLFRDVILKLLSPLEMSLVELKTVNVMGNWQIKFKPCQPKLITLLPLKRQPPAVSRHQDYSTLTTPQTSQPQRQLAKREAGFQAELSVTETRSVQQASSISQEEVPFQNVVFTQINFKSGDVRKLSGIVALQHSEYFQSSEEDIATENSHDPEDRLLSTSQQQLTGGTDSSHKSDDQDTAETIKKDPSENVAELNTDEIANTSEFTVADNHANQDQYLELQRLTSHSDEEDDTENDKDMDDEDVIKERIAVSNLTFEETEESNQQDTAEDIVDKETCIICNLTFPNEAMSKQHSQSQNHIMKEQQYQEYQCTLETKYTGHSKNLEDALLECKELDLKNVAILDAFVKAENVYRKCTDDITQIEKSCEWEKGGTVIQGLSDALIAANVTLQLQMNKLRETVEDDIKSESGENILEEIDTDTESEDTEEDIRAVEVSTKPKKKPKVGRRKGMKNK